MPLSVPFVGEQEAAYLRQCIEQNWVASKGPFVERFEAQFASIHAHDDAVSTASGTAALHLACVELGLGPGDEVLVPALTFAASANAVRYTGATPVFVDVDPLSYTIDPADAAERISPRTRAIMAVHLYGHPADMESIVALARTQGLAVIEDATEALGSRCRGRLCGTLGDFGCYSFNGNKVITTGGGGMVLAADRDRLAHVRHLSLQAKSTRDARVRPRRGRIQLHAVEPARRGRACATGTSRRLRRSAAVGRGALRDRASGSV